MARRSNGSGGDGDPFHRGKSCDRILSGAFGTDISLRGGSIAGRFPGLDLLLRADHAFRCGAYTRLYVDIWIPQRRADSHRLNHGQTFLHNRSDHPKNTPSIAQKNVKRLACGLSRALNLYHRERRACHVSLEACRWTRSILKAHQTSVPFTYRRYCSIIFVVSRVAAISAARQPNLRVAVPTFEKKGYGLRANPP